MSDELSARLPALWKQLGAGNVMTLSTCSGERVTSRSVSVVIINEKFYFQTDERYLKYQQILKNANVALCSDKFSIEGICRDIGKPCEEKYSFFEEQFKKKFFPAFKMYSKIETERLLEITPTLIYSWSYKLTKPYMEFYDFLKKSYRKEEMQ